MNSYVNQLLLLLKILDKWGGKEKRVNRIKRAEKIMGYLCEKTNIDKDNPFTFNVN